MKNKIVMIVLLVTTLLLLFFTIFGLKIGNFEIPSISKLIEKNNNVNSQIDTESELTSTSYPNTISNLEKTINDLRTQKEKYEQISGFESGEKPWYETEQYDISYLWKQLGRLATKGNIKLAIDVKKTAQTDIYDLYFTIQGEYVAVSSYIKKIEDDSSLLFRIYNFKLVPGESTVILKCTFVVKDVRIDPDTLIKTTDTTTTNNLKNTTVSDKNNTEDENNTVDGNNTEDGNNIEI